MLMVWPSLSMSYIQIGAADKGLGRMLVKYPWIISTSIQENYEEILSFFYREKVWHCIGPCLHALPSFVSNMLYVHAWSLSVGGLLHIFYFYFVHYLFLYAHDSGSFYFSQWFIDTNLSLLFTLYSKYCTIFFVTGTKI